MWILKIINFPPSLHFMRVKFWKCVWAWIYIQLCLFVCVCVIFCYHLSAEILDKGVLYFFHISMNNPRLYPKMRFNKRLFSCQGKTHILENRSRCDLWTRAEGHRTRCRRLSFLFSSGVGSAFPGSVWWESACTGLPRGPSYVLISFPLLHVGYYLCFLGLWNR